MTDSSEQRRLAFYAMALMVALERESKLRKGTRRAVLELRMEGCREELFRGLRLPGDPGCPKCGEHGYPITWCNLCKNHDHSVNYNCLKCGQMFWVEDPLGRTKALRRGRAFAGVTDGGRRR